MTRHAVALNPFASDVKQIDEEKHYQDFFSKVHKGIPLDRSNVVGLRDWAVLGVLTYTGARVGALARLRRGDRRLPGSGRHRPVPQSHAPVFGGGRGGLGLTRVCGGTGRLLVSSTLPRS